MPPLLAEFGDERLHRKRLQQLLEGTANPVRIASAYVTDRELLRKCAGREIRLVTSLLPADIACGATSLETLRAFIESGVECRFLPNRPRLHAKVYIFGMAAAVVTSANLTRNAFDSNIEVGVEITGDDVYTLAAWYDSLWEIATPLTLEELADLHRQTAKLRREYVKLKRKMAAHVTLPKQKATGTLSDIPLKLLENATQYFVCNTDRVQGDRTATDGFTLEQEMYNRGYAAAWETYNYPSHMQQVKPGDAIFMFAKGVGIIGIGHATAKCQILAPDAPDRIRNFDYEESTTEWRVPVTWLAWDEDDAYLWRAPNRTFWNVSDENFADFRDAVRQHFFGRA